MSLLVICYQWESSNVLQCIWLAYHLLSLHSVTGKDTFYTVRQLWNMWPRIVVRGIVISPTIPCLDTSGNLVNVGWKSFLKATDALWPERQNSYNDECKVSWTTVACSKVRHVQYHGLRALPQHQQRDVTQGRFLFTDVSLIQEAPEWSSIWSP